MAKVIMFDKTNHEAVAASLKRAYRRINAKILGAPDASFWGSNIVTSPVNGAYPVIGRDEDGDIAAEWDAAWTNICRERGVSPEYGDQLMNQYG